MKARLKFDDRDFGHVEIMLRNIASRVPDTARKTMHRAAVRIVERAKLYVPEDTGDLKNSIRLETSYGVRGRLEINIVMGGRTVVRSDVTGGREVDLDQYALIIHESYSSMNPGKKTLAKMEQNPGKVGERFLTRAFDDDRNFLERDMVQSIEQIIRKERA